MVQGRDLGPRRSDAQKVALVVRRVFVGTKERVRVQTLAPNWVTCNLTCPREASHSSGCEHHIAVHFGALSPSLSELTLSSYQPLVRTLVLRRL